LLALFGGGIGAAFGLIEARKQREVTTLWQQAERDRQAAEVARGEAEVARDGEKKARWEAEDAREKLAAFEYARTIQVALQEWRENMAAATLSFQTGPPPDLRGWEWRSLHRLCHSDLLTLRGHTGSVTSASFSADGTR